MRIETAVVAEAVAQDSRGALTLVGLNQRTIAVGQFPTAFEFVLAVSVTDEDRAESGVFHDFPDAELSVSLLDPGGLVKYAGTAPLVNGEKQHFDLPHQANVQTDLVLEADRPGIYRLVIVVRKGDWLIDQQTKFFYLVDRALTQDAAIRSVFGERQAVSIDTATS